MKRILAFFFVLALAMAAASAETAKTADAVSGASSISYYEAHSYADLQALVNAMNSNTGFYALATVNEDGTPNLAFFVMGAEMDAEGNVAVTAALAENQTAHNLERTGSGAIYYMDTGFSLDEANDWHGARLDATVQSLDVMDTNYGKTYLFKLLATVRTAG